ncbi:MAG: NAD(P)/FAD-dependent oxidoreductase, partial [Pseudomonadota bacterium]
SALEERLARATGAKRSIGPRVQRAFGLTAASTALFLEVLYRPSAGTMSLPTGADVRAPHALAALAKALPITVMGLSPIDRAISTAGGVAFTGLDAQWMLRACPGVFVAGEMVDWDAPTGGYLLQACFASGRAAGRGSLDYCRAHPAQTAHGADNTADTAIVLP